MPFHFVGEERQTRSARLYGFREHHQSKFRDFSLVETTFFWPNKDEMSEIVAAFLASGLTLQPFFFHLLIKGDEFSINFPLPLTKNIVDVSDRKSFFQSSMVVNHPC